MHARQFGLRALFLVVLFVLSASGAAAAKGPTVHVVYPGQTLGMIAKRYNVSIDALCQANGITRKSAIKPKQRLIIPSKVTGTKGTAKDDPANPGGEAGKRARDAKGGEGNAKDSPSAKKQDVKKREGEKKAGPSVASWRKYSRPSRRPGYVSIRSTTGKWQGYALVKGGKVSGRGREGFRKVLASWRTGESMDIDAELIRLLTRVSDQFGGKPIRVVSGFRRNSHSRESRHKQGRAVDFSIEGVPNTALSDYCRTLGAVGVGYYPNSSFVHLDVRKSAASWIDDSGPGQAPRYRRSRTRHEGEEVDQDEDDHDDHDEDDRDDHEGVGAAAAVKDAAKDTASAPVDKDADARDETRTEKTPREKAVERDEARAEKAPREKAPSPETSPPPQGGAKGAP